MIARIALCLLVCGLYGASADVDIITEPRPGEEYVLVSSGQQTPLRSFETSHKIPDKHPNHRALKPDDAEKVVKKIHIGKNKHPSEGIVAIEEDKKSLYKKGQKNKASESIEIDVPVSKIEDIKIKEISKNVETNPRMAVALEAMSESGKLSDVPGTTTQKPILTTAVPASTQGYDYLPVNFDSIDDINSGLLPSNINLETAGSEQKQHSRIQIKKGPNGQDYEYEYIYYYYDEEEEGKKVKGSTTPAPVHNSHDGPQRGDRDNHIGNESKTNSKYSSIDRSGAASSPAPDAQNEVLPAANRGRARGRNLAPQPQLLDDNDDISVRLPSSTRFPPRGRNLAAASSTTYVPEVSSEIARHRARPQSDSLADETAGSAGSAGSARSRTRSHVRRPSSELVDLDSFKTNSGDIPSQYKELPSRYSSESRSTTEEPEADSTKPPREGHSLTFTEVTDEAHLPPGYQPTTASEPDTTEYTTMTAMEKVALDLYAYLAGENLNNEINPTNAEPVDFDGTTTMGDEWTTEAMSTTEEATTTTTTTTSTTTTTTEAPTTTTTAAPTRPSRFKGRAGARPRVPQSSPATEPPQETSTRARGRFGKPGGVRKTTAAAAEVSTQAPANNAEKPTQTKPFGRRGLFAGRTRPSTVAPAPSSQDDVSTAPVSETPAPSRTRLRPGLRRGTTTTTAASVAPEDSTSPSGSGEAVETTPAPARTLARGRPGVRPAALRPGPRLSLRPASRLRPAAASSATPDTSEPPAPVDTPAPDSLSTDADAESSSPTPAAEVGRGGRLRPTRLQLAPSPKPRVSIAPAPRRPNPLLRRKPATEATTEAAKKASSESVEESTASAEKSETETEPTPVESTSAAPLRGLDALIARRRAAGPRPLRPARRA